ncbi:uncharacterized protein LOC129565642 [Sitodiplosis mosellana]|uniref:uncharacterized protein LOC129565642 n=1 Tax=Sitodiplosis mosellana TaxID=263140 RepID=UPI002443E9EA|nr:uncharacterized protein LOC129565642 [Sitodiplosis mosellana]
MSEEVKPLSEIRYFTEFLEENLKRKVLDYTLKPLTKSGHNFGAILQSVEVTVSAEYDPDKHEIYHFVAKTPLTNRSTLLQPKWCLMKEIRFYSIVIPAIEEFERLANVPEAKRLDAFIPCIASRISLNIVAENEDSDAVLLLQNMKFQNYFTRDKHIGFDTQETFVILKNLAKMHALCIAMRRLRPELFDKKVNPYLELINSTSNDDYQFQVQYAPANCYEYLVCSFSIFANLSKIICKELPLIDDISPEMRTTIVNSIRLSKEFYACSARTIDTPYTTVVNKDFWINNIMIKQDDNSKPTKVKFYDFQLCGYESFVLDLIFFLFTSVQNEDLKTNFKTFIEHYFLEFFKTIDFAGCSMEEYTFEKMWAEIRKKAKFTLFRLFVRAKITKDDQTAYLANDIADNMTPYEKPASKTILDQWKFIIEIFVENEFF